MIRLYQEKKVYCLTAPRYTLTISWGGSKRRARYPGPPPPDFGASRLWQDLSWRGQVSGSPWQSLP